MEKQREDAQKEGERKALAEAKKLGKEAHAAVKAQLAQERAAAAEAKKVERLRVAAEQKAEKARLAAESKARRADAKVHNYSLHPDFYSTQICFFFLKATKRKAMSQVVKGLSEGVQRDLPPPMQRPTVAANEEVPMDPGNSHNKFLLHPNDPKNFLKLCTAIRILLHRRFTDSNINHVDRLIREYCAELIPVCPHIIN